MTRWRRVLIAIAALGAAAAAPAAELLVQGEVIDVVPLGSGGARRAADCRAPAPGPGAGLVERLGWDLQSACPAAPAAYRVYYRWDGRTYSRVTTEPPGDTVPLRVRVR